MTIGQLIDTLATLREHAEQVVEACLHTQVVTVPKMFAYHDLIEAIVALEEHMPMTID